MQSLDRVGGADPSVAVVAQARVRYVDEDADFLASVVLRPAALPVARLARSLIGSPQEGEVLREVMLTTTEVVTTARIRLWNLDARTAVASVWLDAFEPATEG